jgi:transposase
MTKRRKFTPEFKTKVVLEVLSGTRSHAEACREYHLKTELLSAWKQEFLANATKAFESDNQRSEAQTRLEELERVVGRLTLELEIAKKASNILEAARGRNGW